MKRCYFVRANSMAEAYRKACKLRDSNYYDYPASVTNSIAESILWNDYGMNNMKEAEKKLSDDKFVDLQKKLKNISRTDPGIILYKYLEWEGIIGYDDEIIDHYYEGDLSDYLEDEGIIGYDSDIEGILKNFKKSNSKKDSEDKKYVLGISHISFVGGDEWEYMDQDGDFSLSDDELDSPRLKIFTSYKEAEEAYDRISSEIAETWIVSQEAETQEEIDDFKEQARDYVNILELIGNETFYPSEI